MKKILAILAVLLLASCGKYPTPIPEKNTVSFEKEGGTNTISINGKATFTENDTMYNYETEDEYDDGMLKSLTMKCGWVNFTLKYYYDDDIHYKEPKLIITTEPNDTGKERSFKLRLVHGRDFSKRPGEAIITVTQEGE